MIRFTRSAASFSAAACLLSTIAVADVLLVGGAGADFDEIADAVAAAADGDVIRVRPGAYDRFAVDNKDLCIFAEAGKIVVTGLTRIRNMERSKSVRVSGVTFQGRDDEALFVYDNTGQVLLQDCTIEGRRADSLPPNFCNDSFGGAAIEDSVNVVLVDCIVKGGDGARAHDYSYYGYDPCSAVDAASALSIYNSKAVLFGGEYLGGEGESAIEASDETIGGHGGDGIFIGEGVDAWFIGAIAKGGGGSIGSPEGVFDYCGNGGAGGDGIEVGQDSGGSNLRTIDPSLMAGAGGFQGPNYNPNPCYNDDFYDYCCYDGAPGQLIRSSPGNTVLSLAGVARQIEMPAFTPGTSSLHVTVEGQPGDRVSLLLSEQPAFLPRPRGVGLLGNVRLGPSRPVGIIPASGTLQVPIPVRDLSGSNHYPLGVQASITGAQGSRHLTNVRWTIVYSN